MRELLNQLLPNVMPRLNELNDAIIDTLVMLGWSGIFIFIIGISLGIVITVTKRGAILENKIIYQILDKTINLLRSIPFIILLTLLLPVTRIVVGTGIGVKGAILPLVFGTVPFYARQIESALGEVDAGIIEASEAMGISPLSIIFKVYLREGIPAIARATTLTTISLIGLTAMAGAIGAGGLGDFAIRLGHNRYMTDVTVVTVIILVILVCIVQILGDYIAKKNTH